MKKYFLMLIIISFTLSIMADTSIEGGSVSGTWDIDGSPYIIQGDIQIDGGSTLSIEAGVEVLFNEDKYLEINGTINAVGTETSHITFDSYVETQKWNGLKFIDSVSSSSSLLYCEITNSKNSGITISGSSYIILSECSIHNNTSDEGGGIYIVNYSSGIRIEHCTIDHNEGNIIIEDEEEVMIGGGGIFSLNSNHIIIESNNINYNIVRTGGVVGEGGGIGIDESSFVEIIANEISYNSSLNSFGGGISVSSGFDNLVENNQIINNLSSGGGGVYLKTACNIVGNTISYNTSRWYGGGIRADGWNSVRDFKNNTIHHNTASSIGGGICILGSGPNLEIINCEIYSNEATDNNGGGMYINGYPIITNCNIYDNKALSGNGGGIFVIGSGPQFYRTVIRDNKSYKGGAIYLKNTVPYPGYPICGIDQCVITSNESATYCGGLFVEALDFDDVSNVNCYNSIFYGNTASYNMGNEILIEAIPNGFYSNLKYNCIEPDGLYIEEDYFVDTEGNIFDDPLFCLESPFEYNLLEGSPCVDAGNPDLEDDDGTQLDIGCYPTIKDLKKINYRKCNWISFPRLEDSSTYIHNVFNTLTPFPTEIYIKAEDEEINYIYLNWDNQNHEIDQKSCYKVNITNSENSFLQLPGVRLATAETIILTAGEENWVGYWLLESKNLLQAFGDDWDKVLSVQSDSWYYKECIPDREYDVYATNPSKVTLDYGKGYIIEVDETVTLIWGDNTGRTKKYEKEPSEQLLYAEKPDYQAIDILEVDEPENILEIGVFENDICIGATKVDSLPVQILVYPQSSGRDNAELVFVILNGRGEREYVKSYQVYDEKKEVFAKNTLFAWQNKYSRVKLSNSSNSEPPKPEKVHLSQNYPNPFNPLTKISYSLPQEEQVSLKIYNIKGQLVKTLVKAKQEVGNYTIEWNSTDSVNKVVSSGIYLYKLETKSKAIQKRMLLLK
ncbi:MAG: right-handed parallel beta-helix repeat-containing protein [Candidatus Cloacimonetes bacterium]|nr:right-handed parallel beta-helix repeat-containing protein [Candidatus Cloacimonadota bacterium]